MYLNYLDSYGVEYDVASNKEVTAFVQSLIYGSLNGLKIRSLETVITYATLSQYITVITEFYKWLDNNYETNMQFKTRTDTFRTKKVLFVWADILL